MDESDLKQFKQEIREKAARKVRAKLAFAWHAALFFMANFTLAFINLSNNSETLWFVWPLGLTSLALLLHARSVFLSAPPTEAMLDAEVQRELARRGIHAG